MIDLGPGTTGKRKNVNTYRISKVGRTDHICPSCKEPILPGELHLATEGRHPTCAAPYRCKGCGNPIAERDLKLADGWHPGCATGQLPDADGWGQAS